MTPRARIARPLRVLIARLAPRTVDTGMLHALRDFGAECYRLGQLDVQMATTLPPPNARPSNDNAAEVTGSYSLVEPSPSDDE